MWMRFSVDIHPAPIASADLNARRADLLVMLQKMFAQRDGKSLDREEFTAVLAAVFEHSPWVPARTANKRPFADRADLHAALCETVMKASDDEKLSLIRAHPDLVGRVALTPESKSEQASAGLGGL